MILLSGSPLVPRAGSRYRRDICEWDRSIEFTEEQFERSKNTLPVRQGNVSLSNLQAFNVLLYETGYGCNWRELPRRFLRWHAHLLADVILP